MEKETIYKVGDTVYCGFKKITIVEIDWTKDYPLRGIDENGKQNIETVFTKKGFLFVEDSIPKLSFAPYDPKTRIGFTQERPHEFNPKRGDRVLVWDDDENKEVERIFLSEIKGAKNKIVSVEFGDEKLFLAGKEFEVLTWKNMKPLPQKITLTKQDISEGKGVGVAPELMEIID